MSSRRENVQNQEIRNHQKLIQDQNYSNQIFFGLLSTLESIVQFYQGKSHQYGNKMFKNYDRVSYSDKNLRQLKSQLQSQIFIFQTSRKIFDQENPHNPWTLPRSFDVYKARQFVEFTLTVFKSFQDEQSFSMAQDVLTILGGIFNGLNSQKMNLKVSYSEEEKKKHQKQLFQNGLFAGQEMDKRQAQAANIQNVSQLQAHINFRSENYSNMNNVPNTQSGIINEHGKSNIKHHNQNGQNHVSHEVSSSPQPNKSHSPSNKPQPMDIQGQKVRSNSESLSFMLFMQKHEANEFIRNFSLPHWQDRYHYCKNLQQLQKQQRWLFKSCLDYVVPFVGDKHRIIKTAKTIQPLSKFKP